MPDLVSLTEGTELSALDPRSTEWDMVIDRNSTIRELLVEQRSTVTRVTENRKSVFGVVDFEMQRYHDIHLPKCRECFRRWPYPRGVSFLAGIPYDMRRGDALSFFEPVTKNCLVAYQSRDRHTQQPHLREEIFSRLKLTHTPTTQKGRSCLTCCKRRHALVRDFDYNRKTGDVIHCREYFDGEDTKEFRYARLLTLNSWHIALLRNILNIIVDIGSLAVGTMMLGQLFSKEGGFLQCDYIVYTRLWFACWYYGCLIVALCLAYRSAKWEWKANSSPNVGDIIIKCHRVDRVLAFIALTVLMFLGVDKLIKDIVKILHPWKSVQPFAAVKLEGVRIHILGYKSRSLYHVENSSGQFRILLVKALNQIIDFIYKVTVIAAIIRHNDSVRQSFKSRDEGSPDPSVLPSLPPSPSPSHSSSGFDDITVQIQSTLIISTLVSLLSAYIITKKVLLLFRTRRHFKHELLRILRTAEIKGDMAKQGPAKKLLALHFHQEFKDGAGHKVTPATFKVRDDNKCSSCGREYQEEAMASFCLQRTHTS